MENNTKKENTTSSIILNNQRNLKLTGISDIISCNDKTLILKTSNNRLTITGSDINVTKLIFETGELEATGNFDCIKYSSSNNGGLMKRIFK